jgi:hypothetical protein
MVGLQPKPVFTSDKSWQHLSELVARYSVVEGYSTLAQRPSSSESCSVRVEGW